MYAQKEINVSIMKVFLEQLVSVFPDKSVFIVFAS